MSLTIKKLGISDIDLMENVLKDDNIEKAKKALIDNDYVFYIKI